MPELVSSRLLRLSLAPVALLAHPGRRTAGASGRPTTPVDERRPAAISRWP